MSNPEFVYTTYIRANREKVWGAIITPEFTRQYWTYELKSDWNKGSQWRMQAPGTGKDNIVGEVLEAAPPSRLVLSWAAPEHAHDKSHHSRVTFELEQIEDMVCLTVTHDQLVAGSDMAKGIRHGWPRVLASMKSFLETGRPLNIAATKERDRKSQQSSSSAA